MAKKTIQKIPSITLSDCIRELEIINDNVFTLKQTAFHLVNMIEGETSNADLKKVIEVYNLREILCNLNIKV